MLCSLPWDPPFARKHTLTEGQVHKPRTEVNGPFARQLSLELTEQGDIKNQPALFRKQRRWCVSAVGDCTTPLKAGLTSRGDGQLRCRGGHRPAGR